MKNHKWDNSKSIVQTCVKCGVSRSKLKRKYGSWEYIDKNNITHSERIECLTALSKGHKSIEMEKNTIKDLKKNDQFVFNDRLYTVKRKWINDDKPLIAFYNNPSYNEDRFHYEDLEINYAGTTTKNLSE